MKLWLIPASDGRATENIAKTLSHPISGERGRAICLGSSGWTKEQ
jgi:hypothetical protein